MAATTGTRQRQTRQITVTPSDLTHLPTAGSLQLNHRVFVAAKTYARQSKPLPWFAEDKEDQGTTAHLHSPHPDSTK